MTSGLRILIVDDDLVDRLATIRALRAAHVAGEIVEADTCAAALSILSLPAPFDVLVFDYQLPDGDGGWLLQRAREAGSLAPVIVLTGRGDERIAVELMKAGASDYLPKTELNGERLAQSIRAALRVREAESQAAQAQAALRFQLDTRSAIMGSLNEGLVAVDEHGRITFLNPAAERMLGWKESELLGTAFDKTFHAHERGATFPCRLRAALVHQAIDRTDDEVFLRRDGTAFPVSFASSPIMTGGRTAGAVVAFHDITARRRAEAELEHSRRQLVLAEKLSALGTLVSGVAHELRTPLTYIANNVHLLRRRLVEAARTDASLTPLVRDVENYATQAQDGVDRISALVRELRPFTKDPAREQQLVSLDGVVSAAVDLFRATHRGQVEVKADMAATPPVRINVGQVQRVVINLLNNAADAMKQGGVVRVRTRATEMGAEIVVEDTGGGIPREVESRIFDPFFTTKSEGTGLGLTIARSIVESHGGSLRYESVLGRGTTFRVSFPPGAVTEAPAPAPRMPAA